MWQLLITAYLQSNRLTHIDTDFWEAEQHSNDIDVVCCACMMQRGLKQRITSIDIRSSFDEKFQAPQRFFVILSVIIFQVFTLHLNKFMGVIKIVKSVSYTLQYHLFICDTNQNYCINIVSFPPQLLRWLMLHTMHSCLYINQVFCNFVSSRDILGEGIFKFSLSSATSQPQRVESLPQQ